MRMTMHNWMKMRRGEDDADDEKNGLALKFWGATAGTAVVAGVYDAERRALNPSEKGAGMDGQR